jgi:hypothetical protein
MSKDWSEQEGAYTTKENREAAGDGATAAFVNLLLNILFTDSEMKRTMN